MGIIGKKSLVLVCFIDIIFLFSNQLDISFFFFFSTVFFGFFFSFDILSMYSMSPVDKMQVKFEFFVTQFIFDKRKKKIKERKEIFFFVVFVFLVFVFFFFDLSSMKIVI